MLYLVRARKQDRKHYDHQLEPQKKLNDPNTIQIIPKTLMINPPFFCLIRCRLISSNTKQQLSRLPH